MTGASADMGEPQKIEGLRFTEPRAGRAGPPLGDRTRSGESSPDVATTQNSSNRLRIASQKRLASTSCAKPTTISSA